MPALTEIAPDLYRFSLFVPEINLQFNHFLLNDDEPLLFTTGFRRTFPALRALVQKVTDPARIRWIGFSHFESTSVAPSTSGWRLRLMRNRWRGSPLHWST
jgi:flavorubredoxin